MTDAKTPWLQVALILLCGVVSGLNMGKIPPALPALREDFALGLVLSGMVAAAFNSLGALFGLPLGALVDRLGPRRLIMVSLLAAAIGPVLGSFATAPWQLVASRIIEGVSFITVMAAGPTLINAITAPQDRGMAMGVWATFMPLGAALSIIAAPAALTWLGWPGFWRALSAVALVTLALFVLAGPKRSASPAGEPVSPADMARVVRAQGVLLTGLVFGVFSFCYVSIFTFIPLWLIETYGLSLSAASMAALAFSLGNVTGNVTAGFLMKHGGRPTRILATATIATALLALPMFLPGVPLALRLATLVIWPVFAGMIPACSFALAARLAPAPRLMGATNGVLVQMLNLSSLVGPPMLALVVSRAGGWWAAPVPLIAVLAIAFFAVLAIDRGLRVRG